MESLLEDAACVEPLAVVSRFRRDFHACLTVRADELSELADAVLCADGPVRDLAGLSLVLEHRRGHGALYDAVNYLPGDRDPKPVWLWWSRTGAAPADVDRCWRSFLRRQGKARTRRLNGKLSQGKPVPGPAKAHLSRQNRDFLRRAEEGLTARLDSDRQTDGRESEEEQ